MIEFVDRQTSFWNILKSIKKHVIYQYKQSVIEISPSTRKNNVIKPNKLLLLGWKLSPVVFYR